MRPTEEFDYVIVGAGSAGCVLADRLTEDGKHTVLVLEYGGSDRSIFVQMPSALSIPMGMEQYDWRYYTRAGARPRRAAPAHAARQGAGRLVLHQRPRVRARQCRTISIAGRRKARPAGTTPPYCPTSAAPRRAPRAATSTAATPVRCRPATARCRTRCTRPGSRPAGRRAIPRPPDINGRQQEGFGKLDMTVGPDGRRCSAANAYLRPAMRRPNLDRAHALARDARPVRRQARDRRRVPAGREPRSSPSRAREVIVSSGLDQLAEAAEALRRRPGGGAARARHPGGARPARRRREPAGPPRVLLPGRLHAADHAVFVDGPLRTRADRRALAAVQGRARRDQSLRDRRLHQEPRRRALSRHPVSTSCRSP